MVPHQQQCPHSHLAFHVPRLKPKHTWNKSFMRNRINTGVERTPSKSQHTKLTLEKKILPPLLPGFKLKTFRLQVRCTTNKLAQFFHSGPFKYLFTEKSRDTQCKRQMLAHLLCYSPCCPELGQHNCCGYLKGKAQQKVKIILFWVCCPSVCIHYCLTWVFSVSHSG